MVCCILSCSNSILNLLKDARSASHATTAERQRNQKGWKSSPMSHLPNLSLLRWQVSQKDVIYTEISRCFIVSEMFLPRVISHLLLVCQPAQIKEACLENSLQGLGRGGIGLALWAWTPPPKYTNTQNKGEKSFLPVVTAISFVLPVT